MDTECPMRVRIPLLPRIARSVIPKDICAPVPYRVIDYNESIQPFTETLVAEHDINVSSIALELNV